MLCYIDLAMFHLRHYTQTSYAFTKITQVQDTPHRRLTSTHLTPPTIRNNDGDVPIKKYMMLVLVQQRKGK